MKISVRNLVVRYGHVEALAGATFDVEPGQVFALLGRNGAGKSSLVRVLLGQRRADAGAVRIGALEPWRDRAKLLATVTATPEVPDAPPRLRLSELERHVAAFYPSWDAASWSARLERFALNPTTRFGALSRGQKSLVMLTLALAARPQLLVLDDPTLGLDAVARRYFFTELVGELAERGTTVFLASHDLDGVERMATHGAILRAGTIVAAGSIDDLRARGAATTGGGPSLEEAFVALTAEEVAV